MKKLLLPFFALVFLISCEKERDTEILLEQENIEDINITTRSSNKRDVCHNGNIININVNAIPAHQAHGDAVDMDDDGYFDIDNPCSETDCDDTDAELTEDCSTTCVEGELEVTLPDGSILYVHPNDQNSGFPQSDGIQWGGSGTDIPDLTNYNSTASALGDFEGEANTDKIYAELTTIQGVSYNYAAKRCKELSTETGCDWYLPALGELKAIYDEYGNTEAKRTENNFDGFFYWSSTEANDFGAYGKDFNNGNQGIADKLLNYYTSCRCVRR